MSRYTTSPWSSTSSVIVTDTYSSYSPTSVIVTDTYSSPYSPSSVVVTDYYSPAYSPSSVVVTDSYTLNPYILTPSSPLTVNLNYTRPIIGFQDTIDNLPEIRNKMLKYYYDVIRDDWLLDDLNDILNYFVHRDGKVSMIKNYSEYNPSNINKDTDKIAEEKVKYIEKNVFTKLDLLDILTKYSRESGTKFVNLPKNELFLKQAIKEQIIKTIKKMLRKSE